MALASGVIDYLATSTTGHSREIVSENKGIYATLAKVAEEVADEIPTALDDTPLNAKSRDEWTG